MCIPCVMCGACFTADSQDAAALDAGRCPSCGNPVPTNALSCPSCYTFLPRKAIVDTQKSSVSALSPCIDGTVDQ